MSFIRTTGLTATTLAILLACGSGAHDERTETSASEISDGLPETALRLVRIEPESRSPVSGDGAFAVDDDYLFGRTPSGDYVFRRMRGGQCLDHGGAGAGAPVAERPCDGAEGQQFRAIELAPSVYRLTGGQGACIAAGNGGVLQQEPCSASGAQRFRIGAPPHVQVKIGRWGKCLDVDAGSLGDGARVQQWECHGGQNQQFFPLLFAGPTPMWVLLAAHSGRCLALANGGDLNGTPLVQTDCPRATWFTRPPRDFGFEIQPATVAKCLDRDGVDNPANGAGIQLWACQKAENQLFKFEP